MLYSEEFCSKITADIQAFFKENNTNEIQDAVIWDASKATLRGRFISQASYKKKEATLMRAQLIQEIANLEKLHKQSGSPKIFRKLNAVRKSLDNLELPQIQKKLIYTKQKFTTKSSYSLKLLSWRVKKRQNKNMILELRDVDKRAYSDPKDISRIMTAFYKNLYTSSNPSQTDIDAFLAIPNLFKKLTSAHRNFMEEPILPQEISEAIKRVKPNKAPGPDGFPIEYYKKFSGVLIPALEKLFNAILRGAPMPDTWKRPHRFNFKTTQGLDPAAFL